QIGESDAFQRHVRRILHKALLSRSLRLSNPDARQRQVWLRNRPKIFVYPRIKLFRIEITDDDERRIVRAVVSVVKLNYVIDRGGVEVFNATDRRALVGMRGE